MDSRITAILSQIEQEQHVQILFAAEAGSRARGLDAPDSDYDVRYVYVRSREDYLRLDPLRDTIEGPLNEELDFAGWDIRKTLMLMRKSNPALMEWSRSPIVYHTTPIWQRVFSEFPRFYSPRSHMLHHLSTAQSDWKILTKEDTPTCRHYLHLLRSLLSCYWLEQFRTPPPVLFTELQAVLPGEFAGIVAELLRQKKLPGEPGPMDRIPKLDQLLLRELPRLQETAKSIPTTESPDFPFLNSLFLEILAAAEPMQP